MTGRASLSVVYFVGVPRNLELEPARGLAAAGGLSAPKLWYPGGLKLAKTKKSF
jgi:hypothetical protein